MSTYTIIGMTDGTTFNAVRTDLDANPAQIIPALASIVARSGRLGVNRLVDERSAWSGLFADMPDADTDPGLYDYVSYLTHAATGISQGLAAFYGHLSVYGAAGRASIVGGYGITSTESAERIAGSLAAVGSDIAWGFFFSDSLTLTVRRNVGGRFVRVASFRLAELLEIASGRTDALVRLIRAEAPDSLAAA